MKSIGAFLVGSNYSKNDIFYAQAVEGTKVNLKNL